MKIPFGIRALRNHNFRLFFAGQSISLIGTWMGRMAVSWLVYRITDSALMLGVTMFAGQFPVLLLSVYTGAFSDRHDRYKVLLFTQIASMLQAVALAVMVLTGYYNSTLIIGLVAVLGVINAFDIPARQSLIVRLVEDKKDVPNAIALNSSIFNLARLFGPIAAGVILSTLGEGICFLVNALSFIAVIISLLLVKLRPERTEKPKENIWSGLSQGFHYLKNAPGLRAVILMMACMSFFVMPFGTLLPVFARDIFQGDATTFTWLNSVSGLGALAGTAYLATLRPGKKLVSVIRNLGGVFSLSLILFAFTDTLPLALCFLTLAGLGMIVQGAGTNTYIQTHVEDHMRGRVLSYYIMAFQGILPIGGFWLGYLAQQIGAPHALIIQGFGGLLTVAAFTYFRKNTRK